MKQQDIQAVNEFADQRDLKSAWVIVDKALEDDPNDFHGLILGSFLCEKEGKLGVGYAMAKRATEVAPQDAATWTNYGRMCDGLWRGEEAKEAFRKALKRADHEKGRALTLLNLSAVYVQEGKFSEAKKYAEQALELDKRNFKALHNLGMCQLAAGEYEQGWQNYAASVGNTTNRPQWKYANETTWQGEAGGKVVIFGEQGIGDEISAASMFPDAIKRAGKVIIECDARLTGLYKRSFPEAKVYGTRNKLEVAWDADDAEPDYSISSFQLGGLFRTKAEDFPGTPYLVPDRDRARMWSALWAEKKKPIVGVAWTGGTKNTAKHLRKWSLEQLLPVFKSCDAHYVALQYVDHAAEVEAFAKASGVDIKAYPWATMSKDYDDTAALVSTLDRVITIQQTALHIAGALGVPTLVGLPHMTQWRYGEKGSKLPWYNSVRLFRQREGESWNRVFSEMADANH